MQLLLEARHRDGPACLLFAILQSEAAVVIFDVVVLDEVAELP